VLSCLTFFNFLALYNYFLGLGGLLPLPVPDNFPVLLGQFGLEYGFDVVPVLGFEFFICLIFWLLIFFPTLDAFRIPHSILIRQISEESNADYNVGSYHPQVRNKTGKEEE